MITGYNRIITVSELNGAIKEILENSGAFSYLKVKGEVSNFKISSIGMAFFTLSDNESSINCVIFQDYLKRLPFNIENGEMILVNGSIGVFKNRGSYNLKVFSVEKEGLGDALIRLEELKKKLYSEGFFLEENKRPINRYPSKIGIISAPNSAALKDMTYNLHRRYPLADLYIFLATVQGNDAPKSIIEAYKKTLDYNLDTLIIGRGGGSSEDLSAFNDESLIRQLATCPCPIISAVGHEIDTTLIDLLADKRASTPTGACELATVDIEDIMLKLASFSLSSKEIILKRVNNRKDNLDRLNSSLNESLLNNINSLEKLIKIKNEHLESINPKNILSRGYTITTDQNNKIIKNINKININDKIITITNEGNIISKVEEIK